MKKVYLVNDLLLTTRQTTKLKNAFENNIISTDINLSRAQIPKIIQSWVFLSSLLSRLAGPLMKVAVLLTKHILAAIEISAAASTIDAGIQKNMVLGQQL